MYFTDLIKKSFQNLKSRKVSTAINIILLTLSLIVVLSAEMFLGAYNSLVNRMFYQPMTRTFEISMIDEGYDSEEAFVEKYKGYLEDDERIEYIGKYYNMQPVNIDLNKISDKIEKDDYRTDLFCYNPAYDEYTDKEKDDSINKYDIYVPEYINYNNEYMDMFSEIDYLDGKELVGKEVTIKFKRRDFTTGKSFEIYGIKVNIAGTYDNFSIGSSAFEVMASAELMEEIYYNQYVYDENSKSDIQTAEEVKQEYENYINEKKLQVTVKDYEDVEEVMAYLGGKTGNYYAYSTLASVTDEVKMIESIIQAVKYAGFILIILSVINITFSLVKSISKRKKEFALLSAMGYRNRYINAILLGELGVIAAVSLVISLLVYNIAAGFLNYYLHNNMDMFYTGIYFEIPLHIWLIRVLMFIAALMAAFLFGVDKIKKIVPAKELKGDN